MLLPRPQWPFEISTRVRWLRGIPQNEGCWASKIHRSLCSFLAGLWMEETTCTCMWLFTNVACVHTYMHTNIHTHIQSWKMVMATYSRSRCSKPQSTFLDLEKLQEHMLHLPRLWGLPCFWWVFRSLDTLGTYFHFTMSAHVISSQQTLCCITCISSMLRVI